MPVHGGSNVVYDDPLHHATAYVGLDASKQGFSNYFLMDGVADGEQLRLAVAYIAGLGGGSLYAPELLYNILTSLITCDNLLIQGKPGSTVFRLVNGANTNLMNDVDVEDNITLRDIIFDGNGANQTDGGARNDRATIILRNKPNVFLDNIEIRNTRHGAGAVLDTITDLKISDSRFIENGILGAAFICDHVWIGSSTDITVGHSIFDTCTDVGLALDNNQVVTVGQCEFNDCENGGSTFWNADDARPLPLTVTYSGCTFTGDTTYSFYSGMAGGETNTPGRIILQGCHFFDTGDIEFRDTTTHVNFMDNDLRGTEIKMDDVFAMDIHDNRITDCVDAIEFRAGTPNHVTIKDNRFIGVTNPIVYTVPCTNEVTKDNIGYVTENSGTATIPAAVLLIVVAHGCDYTPAAAEIDVRLTNLPTADIGDVYITAIGAANFTINCRTAPGVATAIFAWSVRRL